MTPLEAVAVDPVLDGRWAALVEHATHSTAFHHPEWLGLLQSHYGFRMSACCIARGDGALVAGLPFAVVGSRITRRRLVALPFSDACPPLLADDAPRETAALLAAALERARGDMPLEVRGAGEVLAAAPRSARFRSHVLALEPDVEAVVRRFRKAYVHRGVRRARREGVTVERRIDAAALAEFYGLHVATRARLGVPTQPRRFVLRFEELFARELGFVLIARAEGRPVAAAVFLTHHDVITYKYGASDTRFLRLRPNNLVFMEAIEWACGAGMRALDFGRTDWGHESLRAFKLAWGADEHELSYRRLGGGARPSAPGATHRMLAAVLRHSPPIVSRVTGEVLYRHAA